MAGVGAMGSLRFLFALAVAIGHSGGLFGYYMINGVVAVQGFFVISGFLIALILSGKYDGATADGRWLFYTNRALRIFIPYWFVFCATLAILALIYATSGNQVNVVYLAKNYESGTLMWAWVIFTNLFIVGQEWAMWLVYKGGSLEPVWSADPFSPHLVSWQVLPQAWSISLELMFYALAPFLVRRHWSVIATIVFGSFALRFYASEHGFDGSGFAYRFFPFEIGLFLAGALSYRLYAVFPRSSWMFFALSATVTTAVLGAVLVYGYVYYLALHPFGFLALVAISLPFLFCFTQHVRFDRWLGELSYPIYLIHVPVLSIGYPMWRIYIAPIEMGGWFSVGGHLLTIALSIAFVRYIDHSLEAWRQHRVAKPVIPSEALTCSRSCPRLTFH